MSWNTKRDGYYTRPATNPLGHPVSKLEPREGTTHVVTIPGTTFKCFLGPDYMKSLQGKPPRVESLLKSLARTTIPGVGKRRAKCAPELHTLQEWQTLTTNRTAA